MSTRLFRELSPFASHLAVAILAVVTWVFIILPLWRRCRPRLVLLSKNKLLLRRLATAGVVLLVFAAVSRAEPSPEAVTLQSLDAASHKDVGGNPEGSVMGITEVKAAETPDPDAETNLALRIGIKKQPGATVNHTKVKILVEFYDTVGEKDVKLTDADVNYEWLTPNHDWTDANPEVLSVSYVRPKTGVGLPESSLSDAAATIRPGQKGRGVKGSAGDGGKRKYLGYRIRIYYDDKLQAVQAEPSRLVTTFSCGRVTNRRKSQNLFPQHQHPHLRILHSMRSSVSPYATAKDFAKYAIKLRELALPKVQPQIFIPTSSRPATQRYPWKTNIITTVFWIGKKGNYRSVWDANWTSNYGGFDNPDSSARRDYIPTAFVPKQNPFYCALPYNDVTQGQFKPEAPLVIPWFKQAYTGPGQSVCWHQWLAIRRGNRTCYAEWEDCGPFRTDHFQYVFGNERPKPNANHGAGLNVSPAVRDYLGLAPTDVTDWQFVEVRDVPPGPWRSYGENNHFVIARRQNEQRLMEQKSQQSDQNSKK